MRLLAVRSAVHAICTGTDDAAVPLDMTRPLDPIAQNRVLRLAGWAVWLLLLGVVAFW